MACKHHAMPTGGSTRQGHGAFTLIEPFDSSFALAPFGSEPQGRRQGKLLAVRKGKAPGFTLIELLVVIAIISLLVSVLLPSLSRAKELARRAVCARQLRTMGLGITIYCDDFDGHLPYTVPYDWSTYYWDDPERRTWTTFTELFGQTTKGKYFPWQAMDCPSDQTRTEYVDYWPYNYYFGDTLNLSYAYNGHLMHIVEPGWPWGESHTLDRWNQMSDDVLMFEVGPPIMAPNYHAEVGGPTNTGGNHLMVVGEMHHGEGNNYLFLDLHVTYHTEQEYLDTLRYQGDEIYDPNWGIIPVNYWAD